MYEVVRLMVCQRFYKKKKFKIIPRKCKRLFFEKRNCDFLNCRNMIVFVGMLSPGVHYLFIFWAYGPSQGLKLSEEGKSWLEETVLLNKKVSFGHNDSRE